MEEKKEARDKVFKEITADDPLVRAEFLRHFGAEAKEFSEEMAQVMLVWLKEYDDTHEEKRQKVIALVFTAIHLNIGSMKLLLSGNMVASGNLFRQVLETIALALLCSGKNLNFLERFDNDKYSTKYSIRDVLRHYKKLGLREDGVRALKDGQEFYHKYSHVTKFTIGAVESFADEGIYVGASFDEGKLEFYAKEVAGRLSLARVFNSFITAVKANIKKW